MAVDGPGYKVALGSSSGEPGVDGVYTKMDDPGSAVVDYYYHETPLTYRIGVPKSGGPAQLERLTAQTRSYYWKALFTIVPGTGSFKVQRVKGTEGNVDVPGAEAEVRSRGEAGAAGPPGGRSMVRRR